MWTINPPWPSPSVDTRAAPWKWRRNGEGIERKWRANGEGEEGDEREDGNGREASAKVGLLGKRREVAIETSYHEHSLVLLNICVQFHNYQHPLRISLLKTCSKGTQFFIKRKFYSQDTFYKSR
jgi:hypothetical protein